MSTFKGTTGALSMSGDNYSIDIILSNNSTISVDRHSRYVEKIVCDRSEMESNAQLIVDALTVRQQINCELPELLNTLRHIQTISDLGIIKLPEFEKNLINKTLNP